MMLDEEYRDKMRETLNKIDKKTRITRAEKTRLLNQLSIILLDSRYLIQPMMTLIITD